MRASRLLAVIFLAAALVGSTALGALKPDTHSGFFIGLGGGAGSLTPKYDEGGTTIDGDAETGGFGNFYLGLALSQNVLIGVDGSAWSKKVTDETFDTDATWTFANVAACVWFYPANYFYLKAGPAIANADLKINVGGYSVSGSQNGVGVTVGAGGELRLTQKFAIIPQATFMYQKFSEDATAFYDSFDIKTTTFAISIGVGWYW